MKVLLCRQDNFQFNFEFIKCYLGLIGCYNIRNYNGRVKYSSKNGDGTMYLYDFKLFESLRYSKDLMNALHINDNWHYQNELCPLRVVEIPDDLDYNITINQFCNERIEEKHRIYE